MRSDADLAMAARSGDRAAVAEIYDRYATPMFDMCSRIGSPHEAADAVHDTYLTAMESLDQLRDPRSLKPWLFSIARNRVRRRGRRREVPTEEFEASAGTGPTPEDEVLRADQGDVIDAALDGLEPDDRELLLLRDRVGLDGAETADVLGVERATVDRRLHSARHRLRQSVVACQAARHGSIHCDELRRLRGDGPFTPTVRKRVARHVESCNVCEETAERAASPAALFGSLPLLAPPVLLRDRVLATLGVAEVSPQPENVVQANLGPAEPDAVPANPTSGMVAATAGSTGRVAMLVTGTAAAGVVVLALAWYALADRGGEEDASAPNAVENVATSTSDAVSSSTAAPTSAAPTTDVATTADPFAAFCAALAESLPWWQANQGPASPAPADVEAYFTTSLAHLQELDALAPEGVTAALEQYTGQMAALVASLTPQWNLAAASGGTDFSGLRDLLENELPGHC
ncbi:MAG: sigma-70 family RNA polymerase sigma factor [Actinomycetia bacterium]|nr:sigma-70 family RNA polymerase sigma factor [Actinomycetes bacterium]